MLPSFTSKTQLNIPQIEDGNDFGVGIQEEIINELSRCESDAFTVLDSTTKYYASRAQLITKVSNLPTSSMIVFFLCLRITHIHHSHFFFSSTTDAETL